MTAQRHILRQVTTGATLLPAALGTLGAVAVGRQDAAGRWWASRTAQPVSRPGRTRLAVHALLTLPLGLLALLPIGVEGLFVLRGVFYGLVDDGPYDHSWGGPTRAGAWLAHFAVSVPFAVAGLAALWGLSRLAARLANRLSGRKVGAWPYVVAVAAAVGGVQLFIAWLHQI